MSASKSAPASRRTLALPGDPESAGRARRLLRQLLLETDHAQWLDAAELAVTELVGNAVLHAHTGIEVTAELGAAGLRVEVRDHNPALPMPRDVNEQATTGRGMALVAALTSDHGISDIGPAGKTVWFTLTPSGTPSSTADPLAGWDTAWEAEEAAVPSGAAQPRNVRLLQLPPALWLAARQHHDALLRELALHQVEHPDLDIDLTAADQARTPISVAVVDAVRHAQRTGAARRLLPPGHPSPLEDMPGPLDLELHIASNLGPAFAALQDTLDTAEQLARAGRLLARPGLPEIIAVRDWVCDQITAQLSGVPATPWPGTDHEQFTTADADADADDRSGWNLAAVRTSDRRVVAADQSNRIVAVSAPLARLAGWTPDELVGRRVVTLIPRHLREAHVAGFTRHLTTGEAHVLDVPLRLPLLRADNTEITCRFLVQKGATRTNRTVYFAWIDPISSL